VDAAKPPAAAELAEAVEVAQAVAVAVAIPMGAAVAVSTTIRNRKWILALGLLWGLSLRQERHPLGLGVVLTN